MRQKIYYFIGVVIIVVVAVLTSQLHEGNFLTAGDGGTSLKELNEKAKEDTKIVAFAEANVDNESKLGQFTAIANWNHFYGDGFYTGADLVGTASSQFGVMAPTIDFRCGYEFNNSFKIEGKVGNFTRNNVKTAGFDPQFMNDCILLGEAAPVSKAMQLSLTYKGTNVFVGHQNGTDFYKFDDGNYYAGIEQKISDFSVSGGMDFAETTTGYAAAKWSHNNNVVTLTCNKLGTENRNFVASYVHNNISVGKGISMNVGGAFWSQPEKKGVRLVTGFGKGCVKLFAEAGGYFVPGTTFTPTGGLGISYKM
jgi:hypothetical protein